jgi:hypothetical protein
MLAVGDAVWAKTFAAGISDAWWPARLLYCGATHALVRLLPSAAHGSIGRVKGLRMPLGEGLLPFSAHPELEDADRALANKRCTVTASKRQQFESAVAAARLTLSEEDWQEIHAAERHETLRATVEAAAAVQATSDSEEEVPCDGEVARGSAKRKGKGKGNQRCSAVETAESASEESAKRPRATDGGQLQSRWLPLPEAFEGHEEATQVWQALAQLCQDVLQRAGRHGMTKRSVCGWALECGLRGGGDRRSVQPFWNAIPPGSGRADAVRSKASLRNVLQLRVDASNGVEWRPPAVGELVSVHVQDEYMAAETPAVFEWRLAEVRRVERALGNRFQVCVQHRDGRGYDEGFLEWYWKDDEYVEWRRRDEVVPTAAASGEGAAARTVSNAAVSCSTATAATVATNTSCRPISDPPSRDAPELERPAVQASTAAWTSACGEPGLEAVRAFLDEARLSAYFDAFEEQGYDDLAFILSLRDRPTLLEKLKSDVGFKPGHAMKFDDMVRSSCLQGGR